MQASSLTGRIKRCVSVRDWQWWQLPRWMRFYVGALPVAAVVVIGVAAWFTHWTIDDAGKFFLLLCAGMISVSLTPRIVYAYSGLARDFSTIWVLPVAILLPPVYVAMAPIAFIGVLQVFVHRGVLHRRIFTAASISLPYAAISVIFRWLPPSFAGGHVGTGLHALTWALSVAACEIVAGRGQHFLVAGAVKLANPSVRMTEVDLSLQALEGDFLQLDLVVIITLAVALSPALVIIALPTNFLVRRFLEHPILVAQSRTDAKTGLLNVATWESEVESELSRATRMNNPMAVALIDIDHFKAVNDTYGHLVGDRVLKTIAETLTSQSRDYDRAGRFGGEEFVLLLAQTTEADACKIAERLRGYVASLAIPTGDLPSAPTVQVTISIGVTAMERGESFELTDLLAAADSAMYAAKQAGRNQVAFAPPLRDMGLDAEWTADADANSAPNGNGNGDGVHRDGAQPAGTPLASSPLSSHRVVLVQGEQAAASLCPRMSLSVLGRARPGAAKCITTSQRLHSVRLHVRMQGMPGQ
jgi:diguanylate cyclase (GGDEF)-like protein